MRYCLTIVITLALSLVLAGCGKSENRAALDARIEQAKQTMSEDMLKNMDDTQKLGMIEGWAEGLRQGGQFSADDIARFQAELKKHYGIK